MTVLYDASSFPNYSILGFRILRLGITIGNITAGLFDLSCRRTLLLQIRGACNDCVKYGLCKCNDKRPTIELRCGGLTQRERVEPFVYASGAGRSSYFG
jgi:hypothetical protein